MNVPELTPEQMSVVNFGGPAETGADLWVPDMGTGEVIYDANREMWHWTFTYPGGGATTSGFQYSQEAAQACVRREMNGLRRCWQNRISERELFRDRDSSGRLIMRVKGHQMVIERDGGRGGYTGFGGREFRFRIFATGEVIVSHNVWSQGWIPEEIRHLLPDNAEYAEG